jgi:hypothetical protein
VKNVKILVNIQIVLAATLHPIIKPWSFRGWALDFIGQIYPSFSKGHRFMLFAMDYFMKWTKTISLKNMTHKEVIEFVTKHIIYRFGIPQTLTTDQGTSFTSGQVHDVTSWLKPLIGLIEYTYHQGIPSFLDAQLKRTLGLSVLSSEQF